MSIDQRLRKLIFEWSGMRITGKRCEFRFQDPPLQYCRGLAFRDGDDGCVIYIRPDLSDNDMLDVALHELGHVRMDHDKMMDVSNEKTVIGRCPEEVKRMPETREDLAWGQAAKWRDICDRLDPNGDSISKIYALSKYCAR